MPGFTSMPDDLLGTGSQRLGAIQPRARAGYKSTFSRSSTMSLVGVSVGFSHSLNELSVRRSWTPRQAHKCQARAGCSLYLFLPVSNSRRISLPRDGMPAHK
jgi:hypothetical protein